ncbi:MAG: rRNA pseudouridine synthase [Planctomycetes bacterium]|nr:rRNA pseudouridine synthase [Planctomycetota bacterium]
MPPRSAPRAEPLERVLSKWRVASRTQAQHLVRAGRVRVDGAVVLDPRRFVDPARARIEVDGVAVARRVAAPTWLALNKPRGVVSSTSDPQGRRTVMDLVAPPHPPGLAPVGRLDQASAGLLLLTDDAGTAARLLDPTSHVEKRYRVKVAARLAPEELARLRQDTVTEDGLVLGPMRVEVEAENPRSTWIVVTLREGKNRQIRRRIADLGHEVEVLVRTAFGPIELGDLAPGACRPLRPDEVATLTRASGGGPGAASARGPRRRSGPRRA